MTKKQQAERIALRIQYAKGIAPSTTDTKPSLTTTDTKPSPTVTDEPHSLAWMERAHKWTDSEHKFNW